MIIQGVFLKPEDNCKTEEWLEKQIEENNRMLKEILVFVRKVDSASYKEQQNHEEFLRNVAADILVEIADNTTKQRFLINQKFGMNLF